MKMRTLLTIVLTAFVCMAANAVPAHRDAITVQQPDGTMLSVYLLGDEFNAWHTTSDGYAVVQDSKGCWVYAQMQQDGRLKPTATLAHNPGQRTLADRQAIAAQKPFAAPAMTAAQQQMKRQRSEWKPLLDKASFTPTPFLQTKHQTQLQTPCQTTTTPRKAIGFNPVNFRGLVILVEFNDQAFSRPDYPELIRQMINQPDYTGYQSYTNPEQKTILPGSVRDYYFDSSAGQFDPQFDVVGPVKIDYSKYAPKAADNMQKLIGPIVRAAKEQVDTLNFADYDLDKNGDVDMIFFLFAGFGSNINGNNADLLWPHAWQFNTNVQIDGVKMGRYACSVEMYGKETAATPPLYGIGCICHEFSHVLGLQDEYDTDYATNGLVPHPNAWSVMAEGCYLNKTNTPCSFSLFQRYSIGFAQPQTINQNGEYILPDLDTSNTGYRLDSGQENEYFLLENRRKTNSKWNAYLPGEGMLAYRVDSTNFRLWTNGTFNNNANHPCYLLLRANPNDPLTNSTRVYDSPGDPFPGTGNATQLTNQTTPSLISWSGKPCPFGIYDIQDIDAQIHFTLTDTLTTNTIHNPILQTPENQSSGNHLYPKTSTPIHNLQGQKVSPDYRGLIIQNRRKILKTR